MVALICHVPSQLHSAILSWAALPELEGGHADGGHMWSLHSEQLTVLGEGLQRQEKTLFF